VRLVIFKAVKIQVVFFWVMTLHGVIIRRTTTWIFLKCCC